MTHKYDAAAEKVASLDQAYLEHVKAKKQRRKPLTYGICVVGLLAIAGLMWPETGPGFPLILVGLACGSAYKARQHWVINR